MKLVVDGSIYSYQIHGGITRVCNEILPRICAQSPNTSIDVLTLSNLAQPFPDHQRIQRNIMPLKGLHLRYPRSLWRRLEPSLNQHIFKRTVKKLYGNGDGLIWFAPYYQIPGNWRGPVVVTIHDMAYERFPKLFSSPTHRWLVRQKQKCMERADTVICVSNATRDDVLHYSKLDPNKMNVIHHAPAKVFHRQKNSSCEQLIQVPRPFLLNLGNRSRNKNFDLVLEGYSKWKYRNEIALVVVGRPWSYHEEKRLTELGIDRSVIHLDFVNDSILACLYNLALAFVFPSLYEGFGLPILEAMACGCPIVASCIPTTIEVAGDVPIYFEPTDAIGFRNALDQLVAEGHNEQRILKGLERTKEFSWDRAAKDTLRLFYNLQ